MASQSLQPFASPLKIAFELSDDFSSSQQSSDSRFACAALQLKRCASVSSAAPQKNRGLLHAASPAAKRHKDNNDSWRATEFQAPVISQQQQCQQQRDERCNNTLLDSPGLASEERLDEDRSDVDCETPLAPRFVADIEDQAATDEFAERLSHLYDAQDVGRLSPKYLEECHGPDLQPQEYLDTPMRTTVVSWLVEVGLEFHLHQESVFLAVALFDRYLANTQGVVRSRLQLISVACLLVATKHEEERAPLTKDFVNIAENSFQVADLVAMEKEVLVVLDYRLKTPTPHTFWSAFTHASPQPAPVAAFASYLIELSLLDTKFLQFAPSETAATAVLLALGHQEHAALQQGLNMPAYTAFARLAAKTGYRAEELGDCAAELCMLHARASAASGMHSPFMAVKDKYDNSQWAHASRVKPADWLPEALCGAPPAYSAAAALL